MVIVLEKVPVGLRGELTRWLLEVHAGVFVGRVSAMVREKLWTLACNRLREGAGLMVYSTDNEQGFSMRSCGTTSRTIRDFEGLLLVSQA